MGKFNLKAYSDCIVSFFAWNVQNKSTAKKLKKKKKAWLAKSIDLNKFENKNALQQWNSWSINTAQQIFLEVWIAKVFS